MEKLLVCLCVGQNQGGGGGGGGTRGYLKLFTSDCGRHIAVGRDGGVWGEAMMGVRRVVGRGFNQSFEQNRYRYIEFGYRYAYYETKLAKKSQFQGGFPNLAGNPRIMTSYSRKNVTFSLRKQDSKRFRGIAPSHEEEGKPSCLIFWAHLRISKSIFEAMAAYFH